MTKSNLSFGLKLEVQSDETKSTVAPRPRSESGKSRETDSRLKRRHKDSSVRIITIDNTQEPPVSCLCNTTSDDNSANAIEHCVTESTEIKKCW